MNEFVCPYCDKRINLIRFASAWIGVCCRGIVYNSPNLPQNVLQELKNRTKPETLKDGKTTGEIAGIIGVAASAIDTYRNKIRHKLNLNNKKINLQSYLQSIK